MIVFGDNIHIYVSTPTVEKNDTSSEYHQYPARVTDWMSEDGLAIPLNAESISYRTLALGYTNTPSSIQQFKSHPRYFLLDPYFRTWIVNATINKEISTHHLEIDRLRGWWIANSVDRRTDRLYGFLYTNPSFEEIKKFCFKYLEGCRIQRFSIVGSMLCLAKYYSSPDSKEFLDAFVSENIKIIEGKSNSELTEYSRNVKIMLQKYKFIPSEEESSATENSKDLQIEDNSSDDSPSSTTLEESISLVKTDDI